MEIYQECHQLLFVLFLYQKSWSLIERNGHFVLDNIGRKVEKHFDLGISNWIILLKFNLHISDYISLCLQFVWWITLKSQVKPCRLWQFYQTLSGHNCPSWQQQTRILERFYHQEPWWKWGKGSIKCLGMAMIFQQSTFCFKSCNICNF